MPGAYESDCSRSSCSRSSFLVPNVDERMRMLFAITQNWDMSISHVCLSMGLRRDEAKASEGSLSL